jgi:hypothetical protein
VTEVIQLKLSYSNAYLIRVDELIVDEKLATQNIERE